MMPNKQKVLFVPKIYGFKIYGEEGSEFKKHKEEDKENFILQVED